MQCSRLGPIIFYILKRIQHLLWGKAFLSRHASLEVEGKASSTPFQTMVSSTYNKACVHWVIGSSPATTYLLRKIVSHDLASCACQSAGVTKYQALPWEANHITNPFLIDFQSLLAQLHNFPPPLRVEPFHTGKNYVMSCFWDFVSNIHFSSTCADVIRFRQFSWCTSTILISWRFLYSFRSIVKADLQAIALRIQPIYRVHQYHISPPIEKKKLLNTTLRIIYRP